ncbi:hypothetical protein F5Y17DRAFT_460882 [Xylariaceae sp. FL0594]|nr:hypothetical protein F5Y17DRAFT_460882 [Xylariaceae sp. FL0594]
MDKGQGRGHHNVGRENKRALFAAEQAALAWQQANDEPPPPPRPTAAAAKEKNNRNRDSAWTIGPDTWIWKGRPIESYNTVAEDPTGHIRLTKQHLDDREGTNTFNNIKLLARGNQVIKRLVVPRKVVIGGEFRECNIPPSQRSQKARPIAAHLLLDSVNVRRCVHCSYTKRPSRTTLHECVSFGPNVFGGACSACSYVSQAATCQFHETKLGSEYAEGRVFLEEEEEEDHKEGIVVSDVTSPTLQDHEGSPEKLPRKPRGAASQQPRRREVFDIPDLTSEMLEEFTTRRLEKLKRMIEIELEMREPDDHLSSWTKRPRR